MDRQKIIEGLEFLRAKLYNGIFANVSENCIPQAIEALQAQQDWIPFMVNGQWNGRRPKKGEAILVSVGDKVWEDIFMYKNGDYYLEFAGDFIEDWVWQPLPEPWKGENR